MNNFKDLFAFYAFKTELVGLQYVSMSLSKDVQVTAMSVIKRSTN